MEFDVLGWPPDGPTLRLDYRVFAYAGKFVMSNTGKAVVRETDTANSRSKSGSGVDSGDSVGATDADYDVDVVAALAFNTDRTDGSRLWYRYISVRSDAKGSGLGPRLAAFVALRAADRGYERIAIAVNNPFAYEAMYKAGFEWTGDETGVAELVLERPARPNRSGTIGPLPGADTYRAGLDRYRQRDLGDPEASFLRERIGADPPTPCDPSDLSDNPED
ncbi:GNAT family N-acetyltransferase [Halobellus captivus]|uniref:GNAT family N-acetyltransferase n=1 Tax=Halobellus captivus TaxID=2592614 RepID=UPI0011A2EB9F|nr:GNAT family N-acetyltransferase [Halobellus captivus]